MLAVIITDTAWLILGALAVVVATGASTAVSVTGLWISAQSGERREAE